jgi:acyl carrier protein
MTMALVRCEDVETRVRRLLCELLLLDADAVRPASLLVEELDLDSLAFIELAFAVEKEFGVEFPDLKANEETFALLLPDALQRIESMPGGTTFFEFIKQDALRGVVGNETREGLFRSLTAAALAQAVGGSLPSGLDPDTPLATLHLSDLFRFLTVGTLVRYVEQLIADAHG